jgi:hypothetical protein
VKSSFLIAAAALLAANVVLCGQTIAVTSPRTGDDWGIGGTYSITWMKSGTMSNRVTVHLRRAGSRDTGAPTLIISDSTANDGELSWTIPASVPAGEYFIRLRTIPSATAPAEVTGDSPGFSIQTCASAPPENPADPGTTPPGNPARLNFRFPD